ncbi:ATP-grasp domain-containing protein [Bacillus sp. ISL-47]|uniref:ATP-grasp domain-containing protein n=1 Tax=Bacillus sp. ISL-47 TaxID=2819130 RepID=UPI001BEBE419|nr:ATP-grasp domain-containing protein [Bacillus sp. ISL-47]MBT2686839.1 ATP-grasp domain-containing protein [Bacillus sp. ISL-47]MBT2706808.1 ATP-grasp domain-containing protein [Pseudomonas sp. ISL-84]
MPHLRPKMTLYDIFGPGFILNPRASYHNMYWLPDLISQHSATGGPMPVAGKLPLLCHHDVTSQAGTSILKDAGLDLAPNRIYYSDKQNYYEVLDSLESAKEKIIFNCPHLPEEFDYNRYWIDPELIFFLNNKKSLGELVPKENLARREILAINDFLKNQFSLNLPFVVKAATNEPSGGGNNVVICKDEEKLQYAKELLKSCEFVIIEEYIPINANYCVQFAKTYQGELAYLGGSEQIIQDGVKYKGNWFERDHQPPKEVTELGKVIMEKAVSLGYWGVAGFDIVVGKDNRIMALDLNFRLNGSTAALLLSENVMKSLNVSTLKVRSFRTVISFTKLETFTRNLINQQKLVPLTIYKPEHPRQNNPIVLRCLLAGNSKNEILRTEQQIEQMFEIKE